MQSCKGFMKRWTAVSPRVQLPGREPSRFPRFPFLVPIQKRETDRETPETGRKHRKPPGFPFPDFTGKLLPDGKLNPAGTSLAPVDLVVRTGCPAQFYSSDFTVKGTYQIQTNFFMQTMQEISTIIYIKTRKET